MKIAVIGAGMSGVIFAINRKKLHPKDEVIIFEHLDKPLKKILATGNGKCNIGNVNDITDQIDNEFAVSILKQYDFEHQKEFLNSLNIKIKVMNGLAYPISESAVTVRNALVKAMEKYGVTIKLESTIEDYKFDNGHIVLKTNEQEYGVDKLVFATGGKSSPLLERHGYKIKQFKPALCPIWTKNLTKKAEGARVKANVKLIVDDKIVFDEDGELLFKERGLSGIVIFNMSRILASLPPKPYKIVIDFLPGVSEEELFEFAKDHDVEVLLDAYMHPSIAKWMATTKLNKKETIQQLKRMTMTFDKLYDFDNSQISVGGITFDQLNESLESKKEKGIYFLGELLDYDAPCGGHNLMWAIATGLFLSEKI